MSKFSLYLNIKGINKTSGPCENQKFYLVNITSDIYSESKIGICDHF